MTTDNKKLKNLLAKVRILERAEIIMNVYSHSELAQMVAQKLEIDGYQPVNCGKVQWGDNIMTIADAAKHALMTPF